MSASFKKFNALHHSDELFLLPNAWDAKSAQVFQEQKFPAVGTSSAAVASSLGYQDGEGMPFTDYLFVISRILSSVNIPLTVDMEMGYGKNKDDIYNNIVTLIDAGVAGINIEDSVIHDSKRSLKDAEEFARTIEYIQNKLQSKKQDIFINIRCDTYILNVEHKQRETAKRLTLYNKTGANGIFLPFINKEEDIAEAVAISTLPVSAMCMKGLPGFDTLNKLGIKRVSMGPFLFNRIYGSIAEFTNSIAANKDFSSIV